MARKIQPGKWIRHGNAAASYVALTAAPAAATDGIPIWPKGKNLDILIGIKHTAAGARTFTLDIYGYKPNVNVVTAGNALSEQAATAEWVHAAQFTYNEAANGSDAHRLQALSAFSRLYARLTTSTGSPAVYVDFCFLRV
jgi:hypothetical protein